MPRRLHSSGKGSTAPSTAGGPRRALVCAPVMPEFDREGGSARLYDFMHFLRDAGWKVTFASRSTIGRPDRYVRLLDEAGITALPAGLHRIEDLVRRERFDLALLAFWHIAETCLPVLRAWSPATNIILDSVDLHFVRHARGTFVEPAGGATPRLLDTAAGDEFVRELNAYAAAETVLTVSEKEKDLVNSLLGDQANARVVPLCDDLALSARGFPARRGMVFVGNFRHAPNIDAVRHLCRDILPRLPPAVLDAHPLYVVGNGVTDEVRAATAGLPSVRLVGWVPSLIPYLEQARVAVVPVRYGAGTKQKLVQSLMIGTPSVSTSIGAEGLDLTDGTHLLIADTPDRFAAAVGRLLDNEPLWRRLAANGRSHIVATHGRDVARRMFEAAVTATLTIDVKRPRPAGPGTHPGEQKTAYAELLDRIRRAVDETLPMDAAVAVISKGDEALLALGSRRTWHFPQTTDGVYAGHHPRDSAAAIAHLEALRGQGVRYLLVPATGFWWLDHYAEFRRYLDEHGDRVTDRGDACIIFALKSVARESQPEARQPALDIERLRPQLIRSSKKWAAAGGSRIQRILVAGVYLASKPNTVEDIVARLSESRRHRVRQKWIALGGEPPSEAVRSVTVDRVDTFTPKFTLINALLEREDLSRYDYVMLSDDDVVFPFGFVDHFFGLQRRFGFALAQPARASTSAIDHPIVAQQLGSVARQTLFVEIGPVVSFHRSIFDVVFPFDLTSPMGWGYENVWSTELQRRNLTLGIVDATPVDHSIRPVTAHYGWDEADRGRSALLQQHHAASLEECFRVLRVFTISEMSDAAPAR